MKDQKDLMLAIIIVLVGLLLIFINQTNPKDRRSKWYDRKGLVTIFLIGYGIISIVLWLFK